MPYELENDGFYSEMWEPKRKKKKKEHSILWDIIK